MIPDLNRAYQFLIVPDLQASPHQVSAKLCLNKP